MKLFLLFCAGLLLVATLKLPIGYYTFLRIVISIGAIAVIVSQLKNKFDIWCVIFIAILILFNPFKPIFLYKKGIWMPLDLIASAIFTIKALTHKKQ